MLFQNTFSRPAAQLRLAASMLALVSTAMLIGWSVPASAEGLIGSQYQFFGNPPCSHWVTMTTEAQFAWTNHFLSVFSYGNENFRRKGQQQFKNNEGIERVTSAISTHCVSNPNDTAVDVAGPFLNP